MNNEDFVHKSAIPALSNAIKDRKSKWSSFQPFAILFGVGLLTFILYEAGFKTVVETISRIGWGFLAIILLNGLRHFLRSVSLYLAVPGGNFFTFTDVLTTRLAGESVGVLTFTGMMASETTKTALLKKKLPLSDSLATIVVDNLTYDISVTIFILSGTFIMLDFFDYRNKALSFVLGLVIILMLVVLIGLSLIFVYKFKPITYLLKRHEQKVWFPKFIFRRKSYFTELENDVLHFYLNHRNKFYLLMVINLFGHLLSVTEVYTTFYLLGFTPSVATSYIIESLTKVVNVSFSFIPGNLGVYEGGATMIFLSLGYASAAGVALALVRRGAILFWTMVGLLILMAGGISGVLEKNKSKMV